MHRLATAVFLSISGLNASTLSDLLGINIDLQHKMSQVAESQKAVIQAQDVALAAETKAKQTQDETAKKEAEQTKQIVEQKQNEAEEARKKAEIASRSLLTPVDVTTRNNLINEISSYKQRTSKIAESYRHTALSLIIGSLVLATIGTILSIFGLNKAAACTTAITAVLVGVPKLYPVSERADFFEFLTTQSYSVLVDARLPPVLNKQQYAEAYNKFQVLIQSESRDIPKGTNVAMTTQDIVKEMQAQRPTS